MAFLLPGSKDMDNAMYRLFQMAKLSIVILLEVILRKHGWHRNLRTHSEDQL